MVKRLLLFLCMMSLVLTVGCNTAAPVTPTDAPVTQTEPAESLPASEPEPEVILLKNPLTGVRELEEGEEYHRPVSVMINNISVAQGVQCGLNDADVVYECLVEGGISRLMAVFYDLQSAGQIGSIRSARYTYVQLSRGMDALYVHHGCDKVYTQPFMYEIGMDNFTLGTGNGGFREENGRAYEHTLYTTGEQLYNGLKNAGRRLTNDEPTEEIFNFAEQDAPVTPEDSCNRITYQMSGTNRTTFAYDEQTGKYTRMPEGEVHSDYKTKENTVTDNLFVLYADSPYFDDGYHLRTILDSGKGLYCTKGGYEEIRWEKGSTDQSLKLYDADGQPLTVNPGKSWIAFASASLEYNTVIE